MEAFVQLAMFAAFGLLMLLLFAAFVAASYLMFSRYTGGRSAWGRLAGRYPAPLLLQGRELRWQTVRIGRSLYRSAVGVILSPRGFCLRIWTPGNGPIQIPWSEVRAARATTLVLGSGVALHIGQPEAETVTVPKALYAAMWPYLEACHRLSR